MKKHSGRPLEYSKEDVLDAAIDVFWEKGYKACSTEDLCNRTGLGRGSLYNSFGSKHKLYEEALKRYHEFWIETQRNILKQTNLVKQNLENLLIWAVEEDFKESAKGCMLINASMEYWKNDPTVSHWSRIHANHLESIIKEVIQSGIDSKEIKSNISVDDLARNYLCSFYGLRALNAFIPDLDTAKVTVKSIMANFP
ncbi:TetR/AcrR family transcriptional regulator [Staphylococcus sp. ACRSN]|uniref:TetR/AcrR family transcriptional regulator n=1 Tax=Staphylococcus sp. ACRSN TaxID=2918214 RepID=UPI001EF27E15|nr:TetR/AcrR family transcriptional regulator [Staphylococcus sp. ACRSN]MCG7339257.1 TetR/AcrR family transcriptional regulator [Staphylococcus sp. ACRSN]